MCFIYLPLFALFVCSSKILVTRHHTYKNVPDSPQLNRYLRTSKMLTLTVVLSTVPIIFCCYCIYVIVDRLLAKILTIKQQFKADHGYELDIPDETFLTDFKLLSFNQGMGMETLGHDIALDAADAPLEEK